MACSLATLDRKHNCTVISNHILVCLWLCCLPTMICFGEPSPPGWLVQDKQLGDVSMVSYIVTQGGPIFCGTLFMDIDWGKTAWHLHSLWDIPALSNTTSHLWGECFLTRTKETWGRETTATQNIIIEVIYLVCFGVANVISTLLIFNVPKCLRARWQVLVERICCLWVDLNQWEELYDVLDTGLNGHIQGHTPSGPQHPDTRHWSSWSAGHINTEYTPTWRWALDSSYNITLLENVMKRQSYSYWGLPPCEKPFGLPSKRSPARERLMARPSSWYEPSRLTDLWNWDAGRKLHSYQM